MNTPANSPPAFAHGLRFQCTRCGKCCSGAPGHVWVSLAECHAIARHLCVPLEDFTRSHVRRVGQRLSLLEKPDGDCEFLLREKSGSIACAIHALRPVQCRTWPFWSSNVESPAAWKTTACECPGIDRGPLHPAPFIQAALEANGDLPL